MGPALVLKHVRQLTVSYRIHLMKYKNVFTRGFSPIASNDIPLVAQSCEATVVNYLRLFGSTSLSQPIPG